MRVCIVGFSSLVLLGQLLTALGCTVNSMATMLLGKQRPRMQGSARRLDAGSSPADHHVWLLDGPAGRLIFGLGGECVVVGQSAFVSAWFKVRSSLYVIIW